MPTGRAEPKVFFNILTAFRTCLHLKNIPQTFPLSSDSPTTLTSKEEVPLFNWLKDKIFERFDLSTGDNIQTETEFKSALTFLCYAVIMYLHPNRREKMNAR
jgi:hypothetical protein